jgi:hypothetical protein
LFRNHVKDAGQIWKDGHANEIGIRGRGRPRLRWINDVEDDLRKLGVKRWRTKALDRVERASIIREAKAKLKGSYGYRKKTPLDE